MAIFYVEGNDAQTIAAAAAASIENAAEQRARAEADKTGRQAYHDLFRVSTRGSGRDSR